MLTFRDIRQAQIDGPTAITIGNFDGLHLGHQMLLDQTKRIARGWEADAQPARRRSQAGIADGHCDV